MSWFDALADGPADRVEQHTDPGRAAPEPTVSDWPVDEAPLPAQPDPGAGAEDAWSTYEPADVRPEVIPAIAAPAGRALLTICTLVVAVTYLVAMVLVVAPRMAGDHGRLWPVVVCVASAVAIVTTLRARGPIVAAGVASLLGLTVLAATIWWLVPLVVAVVLVAGSVLLKEAEGDLR